MLNKPEAAKRLENCAGQDFDSRDCRVTNPHITARESIELADYIAELEAERDALAAQVDILRKAIIDATNNGAVTDTGKWVYSIDDSALNKAPAQCLAEIKAQAVADAVNTHPEKIAYIEHYGQTRSRGDYYDLWLSSSDLIQYANQLRRQVKGGE